MALITLTSDIGRQDFLTGAVKGQLLQINRDFTIIDKKKQFKPRIFDRAMFFSEGDLYNRTDHNLSLNANRFYKI